MSRRALLLLVLVALASIPAAVAAAHVSGTFGSSRLAGDGALDSPLETHGHDDAQSRGKGVKPLARTRKNVEVVGRGRVRDAGPSRVADVAASGNYAYLGGFREPRCGKGGVYVMSIANPRRPRQVGFVPAAPGSYVGEGVQVVKLRTAAFRGDVLVQNNEICRPNPRAVGGLTLIDVRNPRRPTKLIDGYGDRSDPDGTLTPQAHQIHSAFAWQDRGRAFVVMVDDEEPADVDIMEITDPRRPRLISETDLNELGVEQPQVNGDNSFLHDMVVKKVDGVQTMLASYWDGGYVQLNVDDPARPTLIRHTDFRVPDPRRAARGQGDVTPEGNAHQSEFDSRDEFVVAADEDFDPYRMSSKAGTPGRPFRRFQAQQGQASGALDTGGQAQEEAADDGSKIDRNTSIVGPTAFLGLACDPLLTPRAADTGATVAIVERGVCTFTDKARLAAGAGYRGVVVFNRSGVDGGCEGELSGVLDTKIPVVFVARAEGFRLLRSFDARSYQCADSEEATSDMDTPAPAVGTRGEDVDIRSEFDGWGYVHLYDRRSARELDTYAIPESQSKRFAEGFGDLSVHEVATDPRRRIGYLSHYAGGLRVVRFGPGGLREVGRYIGRGGSNLWGVEVHRHPNGRQYVLASDRDYGLYVFRYTGR